MLCKWITFLSGREMSELKALGTGLALHTLQ